tara:strand:+ start:15336 stop:15989 length:654 start_codon:yes stop_codon:yes gene_type:complete
MPKSAPLEKQVTTKSAAAKATMAGAIFAAIAASACCVLPAVLALVGVSGLGAAAALEAYRPLFLGVTALLLGAGFYLAYRKPKAVAIVASEGDACGCPAPRTRRAAKPMLWLATLAVFFFASYPYIAGAFAQTEKSGDTALTAASKQVSLNVEGMTCEGCATKIVTALTQAHGVVAASVDFSEKSASITYDPDQVNPQGLANIVSALDGYTAMVASP